MTQEQSMEERDELTLAGLLAVILRGRRTVVAVTVVVALLGAVYAQTRAPKYRASVSFLPQGSQGSLQSLGGLAAQFGVQVPGSAEGESPEFYQALITSREVLASVVLAEYEVVDDGEVLREPFLDLMEIEGDTPEERLAWGIDWLQRYALSTQVGRQTGLVGYSVLTEWPRLSNDVAERILEGVQEFNIERRRTRARAEREFLEGRLEEAEAELLEAESALQAFLQQNREWSNSPELTFRHDRLQRQVGMRQQIFTSLAEAFEQSRIEEVRTTPVINVVEAPRVPALHEPRRRIRRTLLAGALGFMLGVGWVLLSAAKGPARGADEAALREAWAETRADLRRIVTFGRGR